MTARREDGPMTSTEETQALLPVTQTDRHEAWPFVPRNSIAGQDSWGFFDGKYDDCQAVQAFARHRISHSLPGDVGMRELLIEALDSLECLLSLDPDMPTAKADYDAADNFLDRARNKLAALTPSPCPGDVGMRGIVEEFCLAMEYAAGCDEGVDEDTAASEIMSWAGSPMAVVYTKARAVHQGAGEP